MDIMLVSVIYTIGVLLLVPIAMYITKVSEKRNELKKAEPQKPKGKGRKVLDAIWDGLVIFLTFGLGYKAKMYADTDDTVSAPIRKMKRFGTAVIILSGYLLTTATSFLAVDLLLFGYSDMQLFLTTIAASIFFFVWIMLDKQTLLWATILIIITEVYRFFGSADSFKWYIAIVFGLLLLESFFSLIMLFVLKEVKYGEEPKLNGINENDAPSQTEQKGKSLTTLKWTLFFIFNIWYLWGLGSLYWSIFNA